MYSDALNRLADRLHYLNSSGDKTQDATRFWFDTRANLRREMEDRKRRFDDKTEVRGRVAEALKKVAGNASLFDGVHIFTPHTDIPDDTALRLVVLPPESWYSKEEPRLAFEAALGCVRNNGPKPRYRAIHFGMPRIQAIRAVSKWLPFGVSTVRGANEQYRKRRKLKLLTNVRQGFETHLFLSQYRPLFTEWFNKYKTLPTSHPTSKNAFQEVYKVVFLAQKFNKPYPA